jgi:hypothetical protein
MADVVFDGVGTPVNDPNIVGAEANFVPGATIFDNALSPTESELGSPNPPINDPSIVGAEANLVSGLVQNPADEVDFGTAGIPVGDGNRPDFPVTFDNQGKNVTVAPAATGAIDTDTVRQLFSPPLNFNP